MRAVLLLFAATGVAACASVEPALVQTPAPGPARFDEAIAAFETADKVSPPPKCATLFVGSSTIRRWASLTEDFPDRTVLNRGFGGSTVWEVDHYFSRVVAPYKPKEIVFYAGDNDLGATPPRSPDTVYVDFVHFLAQKDTFLGKTPVYFIAVKPSKLRWAMQDRMSAVNARVKALADKRDDLAYIDIVPIMLRPDGTPKDIFVEDNLHMTPEGYALWTPIVDAALDKGQKAKAPGC
jgi:lysophospholipase L1-like esterase